MIKSLSMTQDTIELCSSLRKRYFGDTASEKEYKDSFVINTTVSSFNKRPEALLDDAITQHDQQPKGSKSINFRADCFQKLEQIAKLLNISESEACRRILYYSFLEKNTEKEGDEKETIYLNQLKAKINLLRGQVESALKTLKELEAFVGIDE